MENNQKGKGGRKKKKVDMALLEKLAKLHLSDKVIADCVGISEATLHRRFAEKIEVWQSVRKSKIAEVLYDEAINQREPWALKAIASRHLGYVEKVVNVNRPPVGAEEEELSADEIRAQLSRIDAAKDK